MAHDLARDAIFGRTVMKKSTLTGRVVRGVKTDMLDPAKLNQIKQLVQAKFNYTSVPEWEAIWSRCKTNIGDACKTMRND